MKITRSNYESWFLDFLEGNIDPLMADEFQAFLIQNPDLAEELEMGDILKLLTNNTIQFNAKEQLKKLITDQEIVFQERAVAYHEGDLSLSERINFEAWLSENPIKAAEAEQFGKLKLVPDQTIAFDFKDQLKRKGIILPLGIKVASAAAIILLAYLLFQPGAGVHPEFSQLVDDMKNKRTKNVVLPEGNVKVEQNKAGEKTQAATPAQIPNRVPAKLKLNPAGQESHKIMAPAPYLRAPEPEPSLLKPRGINLGIPFDDGLAVMRLKDTMEASQEFELSELLKVQLAAIRKSDDRELLSTGHLGLSGLQLFARLTGKRLTARKGNDGAVRSVTYNSRLLAFSIPVNR